MLISWGECSGRRVTPAAGGTLRRWDCNAVSPAEGPTGLGDAGSAAAFLLPAGGCIYRVVDPPGISLL